MGSAALLSLLDVAGSVVDQLGSCLAGHMARREGHALSVVPHSHEHSHDVQGESDLQALTRLTRRSQGLLTVGACDR
jgi:hypothetical protein